MIRFSKVPARLVSPTFGDMVNRNFIYKKVAECAFKFLQTGEENDSIFENDQNIDLDKFDIRPTEPQQILITTMCAFNFNVVINSGSGTGKTLAFSMVIIQKILEAISQGEKPLIFVISDTNTLSQ